MTQVPMPQMEVITVLGHSDATLKAYGDARAEIARILAIEECAVVMDSRYKNHAALLRRLKDRQ